MRLLSVLSLLFYLLPGLLFAQRVQKTVVIQDGYQAGKLIRNHTVVHYLQQTRERVEGFVTVSRIIEYADNEQSQRYHTSIETDTLCHFSGTIQQGRKNGTFLAFPAGNIFYLRTMLNTEKTGTFQGFYHSGQLYCEGMLHRGTKVGQYREYYPNGQLSRVQNYLDVNENVLHHEDYYLNGQLHHRGYYHGGNKVNEWQYFDAMGLLHKTEYYNKYGRLRKIKSSKNL